MVPSHSSKKLTRILILEIKLAASFGKNPGSVTLFLERFTSALQLWFEEFFIL
jgi:hypothetical protein